MKGEGEGGKEHGRAEGTCKGKGVMARTHADAESTQPCMVGRRLSMLSPTMLVSPSMTLWAAQMHNAISSTDVSPYDMMVELPI